MVGLHRHQIQPIERMNICESSIAACNGISVLTLPVLGFDRHDTSSNIDRGFPSFVGRILGR